MSESVGLKAIGRLVVGATVWLGAVVRLAPVDLLVVEAAVDDVVRPVTVTVEDPDVVEVDMRDVVEGDVEVRVRLVVDGGGAMQGSG